MFRLKRQSSFRSLFGPLFSPEWFAWYRFADEGDEDGDSDWTLNPTESVTDFMQVADRRNMTHLKLEKKVPLNIETFAPTLSHFCLRQLPDKETSTLKSVFRIKTLVVLDLSENMLSASTLNMITDMPSLQELRLRQCNLKCLSDGFAKKCNMTVLDISNNDFSSDKALDVLSSMSSLKTLMMRKCSLSSVPKRISQLELDNLVLSDNAFQTHKSLEALFSLKSLKTLDLRKCGISSLPSRMSELQKLTKLDLSYNGISDITCEWLRLEVLDLSFNQLVHLPKAVTKLKKLKRLWLNYNDPLKRLNQGVSNMDKLKYLHVQGCKKLKSPPRDLCMQGVEAIKVFYGMIKDGLLKTDPLVTIAVIGERKAGKTSLIRSLEKNTAELTTRTSECEETTTLFEVKVVNCGKTALRFVDLGGDDIYHSAYQLTLKNSCIPVVVINLEQYKSHKLELQTNERAVRMRFWDWLSHLYLANPLLGPPKLVITHKDKFLPDSDEFKMRKADFLKAVKKMKQEYLDNEEQGGRDFTSIEHFSDDRTMPVFKEKDIYEISGYDTENSVYKKIKSDLNNCCQEFIEDIPKPWGVIEKKLETQGGCLIHFDDLLSSLKNVNKGQLQVVLRYMHNSGKLLWFDDFDELKSYVFHNIPEVTKVLAVLFHHDTENAWKRRRHRFKAFPTNSGKYIERVEFEMLIKDFEETGFISKDLLRYLIQDETSFKEKDEVDAAVLLFETFRLLHGPIEHSENQCYIVPSLVGSKIEEPSGVPRDLTMRSEVNFYGLSLPRYTYYQMSVSLLKHFPDARNSFVVRPDGVSIHHFDGIGIQFVYEVASKKVQIVISTSVQNIARCWDLLIKSTTKIVQSTVSTWKASRPECVFYCTHCLIKDVKEPRKKVNPTWCHAYYLTYPDRVPKGKKAPVTGISQVMCGSEGNVLSPLWFTPYYTTSEEEIQQLKGYITDLRHKAQIKEQSDRLQSKWTAEDARSSGSQILPSRFPTKTGSVTHINNKLSRSKPGNIKYNFEMESLRRTQKPLWEEEEGAHSSQTNYDYKPVRNRRNTFEQSPENQAEKSTKPKQGRRGFTRPIHRTSGKPPGSENIQANIRGLSFPTFAGISKVISPLTSFFKNISLKKSSDEESDEESEG